MPAPAFTWGAITVTWPGGCQGSAHICWDEPTPARGPHDLFDLGDETVLPGLGGLPSTARWIGLGITQYDVYIDGHKLASTFATYDVDGDNYSPPPTCADVALEDFAPYGNWLTSHNFQVKAIWNDLPDYSYWIVSGPTCTPNFTGDCNSATAGPVCQYQVKPWELQRHDRYPAGYAAPGSFGSFGSDIPCDKETCTIYPWPCVPVAVPVPGIEVFDTEQVTVDEDLETVVGPDVDEICSNADFCENFEDCGSSTEVRVGSTSCDVRPFACSPTHILRCDLPGPIATPGGAEVAHHGSYWIYPAGGAAFVTNWASCVLVPQLNWELPVGYRQKILVLADIAPNGDPSIFDHAPFVGAAMSIFVDADSEVHLAVGGVSGFLGRTANGPGAFWTQFGVTLEAGIFPGMPNCIELYYDFISSTVKGVEVWVNGTRLGGVDLGATAHNTMRQLRFGAVDYAYDGDAPGGAPSDLSDLSGSLWVDDVCYGTEQLGCPCSSGGPVFLTRGISPEGSSGSAGSGTGDVQLRGVRPSAGGSGGSAGSGDPDLQLGGVRIDPG